MNTRGRGLVFTLLLLWPLPARAPAQTAMPLETTSMPNGRFWSHMSSLDKGVWVWGFQSGVIAAMGSSTDDGKYLVPESSRLEVVRRYYSNLSRDEIAKGADRFYQDTPENAPVAAGFAVQYVTRKANGAAQ